MKFIHNGIRFILVLLMASLVLAGCTKKETNQPSDAFSSYQSPAQITQEDSSTDEAPKPAEGDEIRAQDDSTNKSPVQNSSVTESDSAENLNKEEPQTTQQSIDEEKITVGPDHFPTGVNPLTGLPADNPSLLSLPAVHISVSNFPVSARPQAGLSFSPIVYELFIGEGMTRFLSVFYGDFPSTQTPIIGSEPANDNILNPTNAILGNWVWHDKNGDGLQNLDEKGIKGVRLNLKDGNQNLVDTTTTDSNGYYGFIVGPESKYSIECVLPEGFSFSPDNQGSLDGIDSDFDPESGNTEIIAYSNNSSADFSWDCGLVHNPGDGENMNSQELKSEGTILGDWVWFDQNYNGLQDQDEFGVPYVQVELYHWEQSKVIATTFTDHQGYFQFSVDPDNHYRLEFTSPMGLSFTTANQGQDEMVDSDVKSNGKTEVFKVIESTLDIDAGLIVRQEIGPVRSGRLPYKYIRDFFPGSCLVYAGKSKDVDIPSCASVFSNPEGSTDINNNYLDLNRLEKIAQQNGNSSEGVNYSGNLFSDEIPADGTAANKITMFYNLYNQTQWEYNPITQDFYRFNDLADGSGTFHPSYDKMTGGQLHFSNVIVLFVDHTLLNSSGTIIDLDLDFKMGRAVVFRDNQAYNVHWSTIGTEFEKETGKLRPIKIVYADQSAFPLKPGNTWVHIVTTNTTVSQNEDGYYFRFYAPTK